MAFRPPKPPPVAPKRTLLDGVHSGRHSESPASSPRSPTRKETFGENMSNGIDLLHRRHDIELELMENLRVIVHKRARAEQHYVQELIKIQANAKKAPLKELGEDTNFKTTYDVWNCLMDGMERLNAKMNVNANQLSNVLLKRIDQLIKDKRSARKAFDSTRLRIEQENNVSAQEVQKTRRRYQESKHAAEDAKQRYELSKAKQMESNKKTYHKKSEQLFCAHNEYILAIKNANCHEEACRQTLQPLCLNTFHERMELMLSEWKSILEMFVSCLDVSEDMAASYSPVSELLCGVNTVEEYQQFIINHRPNESSPIEVHEFDPAIMECCRIPLGSPGKIIVNDFCVGDIRKKLDKAQRYIDDFEYSLADKTSQYDSAVAELQNDPNSIGADGRPKHVVVSILKEQIEDLKAKRDRQQSVFDVLRRALDEVGDSVPATVLDIQPTSITDQPVPPVPSPSYAHEYDESAVNSPIKKSNTFGRSFGKLVQRKKSASDSKRSDYHETDILDRPPPPLPRPRGSNGGQKSPDVSDSLPLEEELWFYGEVNRKDAEMLLRKDGDYLIRLSRDKGPVLTMKWQGIAKHFVVQQTEEGYRFEAESFPSIRELLDSYREHSTPVTRRTPAVLLQPVNKAKRLEGKWNITHADVDLGKQLGKGHFGEVWMGVLRTKQNMPVAVKTCKSDFFPDKHKFLKEAEILQQYDHPNIVKLIGIAADCDPVYIIMELMPGGDFINFLRKSGATTPPKQLIKFGMDAANGMGYLASKNCIHRDLAARNCLIGENNTILKISDFGMSREEDSGMYEVSSGTKQVPIKWTAPEALNYGKYTTQSDVWSYGILLWEMFSCGSVPYPGLSNNEARDRVEEGYRMECPRGCPDEVYQIMKECWEYEPEDRPAFQALGDRLKKIHKKTK